MFATTQDYGLATTAGMMFDEVFPDVSATMDSTNAKYARQQQAHVPVLAPVSPCFSEETYESSAPATASITGKFGDIEHKYRVDPHVLGTGHHGSVRECVDRTTGRRFAVKSIRKDDPAVMPGGLAREILLLREMRHDNIVRLVDVFEDADYVHLVTDLYDGGELFDKIVERAECDNGAPCFTEGEAARIIHQILTAVSYMHERGIAHRDLKPENILFESNGEGSPVKIVDFGLARKHHGKGYGRYEPPMSTIVGTPYYIAPEVLRKRYDRSCDMWSVGVIAYILLCGYPPFDGADNDEVHDAVRRGIYRFPSDEWSCTSSESRDFVRRLLKTDPKKRMTMGRALNHPWIAKNVGNDGMAIEEDRQDVPSVEVVFRGLSRREDEVTCRDGPPPRKHHDVRKALDNVRKALFAD